MIRKLWLTREMTVGNGVGQRQSFIDYDENTGLPVRPDTRLDKDGRKEWDRVMKFLKAHRLSDVVDGPALLDHCLKAQRDKNALSIQANEDSPE